MRNLINYGMFALLFGIGVMLGVMSATPGKSESHAILNEHGAYDSEGNSYLIYLPDHVYLSTEEYEALAVISTLYEHIDIVHPEIK